MWKSQLKRRIFFLGTQQATDVLRLAPNQPTASDNGRGGHVPPLVDARVTGTHQTGRQEEEKV